MRSEADMYDLILNTARDDERIRAVILNGSRANPHARRDLFQDFDIVYIVTETASFLRDPAWIDRFGERIILQLPEAMSSPPPPGGGRWVYLMQFSDGNRIDLTLYPLDRLAEMEADSLSVLLLDKDGVLPPFPPPDESDYLPRPPDARSFAECCNEFWWVCPYVAKGLWREELAYARHMLEAVLRPQLVRMLDWYIGAGSGFTRGAGKLGKHLRLNLPPELWALFEQTCAGGEYEDNWRALYAAGELFRRAGLAVAELSGCAYPREDDRRVSAYLRRIHALPRGAQDMPEEEKEDGNGAR